MLMKINSVNHLVSFWAPSRCSKNGRDHHHHHDHYHHHHSAMLACIFHEPFLSNYGKILPGALLFSSMPQRPSVHVQLCHWHTLGSQQVYLMSLSPSVITQK